MDSPALDPELQIKCPQRPDRQWSGEETLRRTEQSPVQRGKQLIGSSRLLLCRNLRRVSPDCLIFQKKAKSLGFEVQVLNVGRQILERV